MYSTRNVSQCITLLTQIVCNIFVHHLPSIGVFFAMQTLGPGCGFLLSSALLRYFTETTIPEG